MCIASPLIGRTNRLGQCAGDDLRLPGRVQEDAKIAFLSGGRGVTIVRTPLREMGTNEWRVSSISGLQECEHLGRGAKFPQGTTKIFFRRLV